MGIAYHFNRIFTVLYPATILLHLLCGWIKVMTVPIFILSTVSILLAMVMKLLCGIQYIRILYRLISDSTEGEIDDSVIVLRPWTVLLPLLGLYLSIKVMAELWGIPLPI